MRIPSASKLAPLAPWVAAVGALVSYLPRIPRGLAFGDGPELLTAMATLGVAHPSGYPLYTLLGHLLHALPGGTFPWRVAFWLSALPAAVAVGASVHLLRLLGARVRWALAGGAMLAVSPALVVHATRVEVYALHLALLVGLAGALARLLHPRASPRPRHAFLAVSLAALGLTHHLVMAFFLPAILLGFALVRARLLAPRRVAVYLGIGLACGLLYLYLPWAAAAVRETGRTLAWGDPTTPEAFWKHVTGAQYAFYRRGGVTFRGLDALFGRLEGRFFGGVWMPAALGLYALVRERARWALALAPSLVALALYIAAYDIPDKGSYDVHLAWMVAVLAALGIDRFAGLLPPGWRPAGWIAWLWLAGWVANTWWLQTPQAWKNDLAEGMSARVAASLPPGAFLFTANDNHNFPMWYRVYTGERPDLVVVDTRALQMRWYRDHLRARHPDVRWPEDRSFRGLAAVGGLLRDNPDRPAYALLSKPWRVAGTHAVPEGWVARIERSPGDTPPVKHQYIARHVRFLDHTWLRDGRDAWPAVPADLACVLEWFPDHGPLRVTFRYEGPGGQRRSAGSVRVEAGATVTWRPVPTGLAPGSWRCIASSSEGDRWSVPFTVGPAAAGEAG